MKNLILILASLMVTAEAFAADRPPVPAAPIAEKKELLFSDDFESSEPAKVWHKVVTTFVVQGAH